MVQKNFLRLPFFTAIFFITLYLTLYILNSFSVYKFFIYYLNDLLINLLLICNVLLLYLYFPQKVYLLSIWFYCILLNYLKPFFFFYTYAIYQKYLHFTPTLLNGLIYIHPPLLYITILSVILYFNSHLKNILFFWGGITNLSISAFITGGLWSMSLFSWGYYWVYDIIEYFPVYFFFISLYYYHTNITYSYILNYFYFILFILFFIFSIRYGLFRTRHSFFLAISNKKLLIIIYCILLQLLFIFYTQKTVLIINFFVLILLVGVCNSITKYFIYFFFLFILFYFSFFFFIHSIIFLKKKILIVHYVTFFIIFSLSFFFNNYILYYDSTVSYTYTYIVPTFYNILYSSFNIQMLKSYLLTQYFPFTIKYSFVSTHINYLFDSYYCILTKNLTYYLKVFQIFYDLLILLIIVILILLVNFVTNK